MSDVPVVVPTYVGYAPRVDGKISDQMWASTPAVGDFRLVGSGEPATQLTKVRVCYDRANLYLSFECFEDQMDRVVAEYANDGDPVWQDDSVEIWVSPYAVADASKSHQFVVNAAGAKTYLRPDWVRSDEKWRAAATRMADRWVAEVAIPFETLRPLGRNETCWRVNFCRNEIPHGETSSWSHVERWFSTCSRFGKLVPPEAAFRFCTFRGEPSVLKADPSAPSGLEAISEEAVPVRSSDYIIPEPQEVHRRFSKSSFVIEPETRIVIDADAREEDLWTVDEINAALVKLGGKALGVVHSSAFGDDPESARNVIIIGESARNRLLRAVCDRDAVRMPRSRYGTGAYVLDVLPERIVVAGTTPVDTYYGMQTLKQLLKCENGGAITVPAVNVRDFAQFAFRGVHLLTARDSLSYIGKLIDEVLAPLKVNHIVLQTDKIAWASHPEVTDQANFMPREDVPKLLEVARRHHITVTPLVQSPGHLEWAFRNGSNLDIAEDPEKPYCYCMSNPKSYEFIFSVMDEAIDLFGHPEYLHAGRDEFDMQGRMPCDEKCKAIGKEDLYIRDTIRIYEHLKSKGCKMMMWGDVLTKTGYRSRVGSLPKDIVINDWRYAPSTEYPTVDFYRSQGFPVVGCTWYDPRNIFTFSSYAARCGIEGMMQTTWTGWKTEYETLHDHPDQVYAYVLSAAWAWNPIRPALDALSYRPDCVFGKLWYGRDSARCPDFSAVRVDRFCNISRVDSGRAIGWLGRGRGNDLREMPDGLIELEGTPFRILPARLDAPAAVMLGGGAMPDTFATSVKGIGVRAKVSALNFLHGCAFAADKGAKVGQYVVHYEDGKTQPIDLIYARNIHAWDDQSAAMSYGFAWRTRAQDGRLVGVSEMRWTNPRPDVRVTSIDFTSTGTEASPFLVAITAEN